MTLRMNRSWEEDDAVVAPLARLFRRCPEQFQVVESFMLDRLSGLTPPARRRERLAFVAERCPKLASEAMEIDVCRRALEAMAQKGDARAVGDTAARRPTAPGSIEAMVACAASLVISRWLSSRDLDASGSVPLPAGDRTLGA